MGKTLQGGQSQQITCTCSDFQKSQWCKHMPPGAVKTGWNPQQHPEKILLSEGIIEALNQELHLAAQRAREDLVAEIQKYVNEETDLWEGKWGDELNRKLDKALTEQERNT